MALKFAEVFGVEVHVTQLAQRWASLSAAGGVTKVSLRRIMIDSMAFTYDGRELLSPTISISSSQSICVAQVLCCLSTLVTW
jgi:hypothetical protein